MATKAQRLVPQLLRAINARDLDAARAALDAGADPNGTGGYNAKPLLTAASIHGDAVAREALVRLLLERGADPNDRGPYPHDNRPVFYAAHCGYDPVVRLLIDAGGLPRDASGDHARNSDGATILAVASAGGLLWLMRRALDEGCRADALDAHGGTALHEAARAVTVDGATKDTAAALTLLLDAGAPLEHQRSDDWGTALHWAVGLGDRAAVETLLARGAALEACTPKSAYRPLHFGGKSGRGESVRAALTAGAQVDPRDLAGRTPLHHAAQRVGHLATLDETEHVLRALIEHGADRAAVDAKGDTPRAVALARLEPQSRTSPKPTDAQRALVALLAP
ncbi:MAG: ankyrin repeat domain-containing protein [Polyangiales bacterium]